MLAVRLLRRARAPFVAAVISPRARIPCSGNFDCLNSWMGVKSQVLYTVPDSSYKYLDLWRFCQCAQKLRNSGCKSTIRKTIVYAVLGSISLWPQNAYCTDGLNMLLDYPETISCGPSRFEENLRYTMLLIGKLLVPLFLFLTVWLNWEHPPVLLAAEVALIFFRAKPTPSSVYIYVDQLQRQIMSREPFLYRFKPLQLKKAEIKEHAFVCLARVEIRDEQYLLIGILGSWWIFPSSSWKKLISLAKSRLRSHAD